MKSIFMHHITAHLCNMTQVPYYVTLGTSLGPFLFYSPDCLPGIVRVFGTPTTGFVLYCNLLLVPRPVALPYIPACHCPFECTLAPPLPERLAVDLPEQLLWSLAVTGYVVAGHLCFAQCFPHLIYEGCSGQCLSWPSSVP